MNAPQTVPSTGSVRMSVEAPLVHLCPFVREVDNGSVRVEWTTAGNTIELHSLRAYLDGYTETEISHEALTQLIQSVIETLPGVEAVSVGTSWVTAGMVVECGAN